MHMDKVETVSRFWQRNRSNGVVTRSFGDIPGITLAKDVFSLGEYFVDYKGRSRFFMVISNPSKPYVRAYD